MVAYQFSPDGTKIAVLLAVDECPEVCHPQEVVDGPASASTPVSTNQLCWAVVEVHKGLFDGPFAERLIQLGIDEAHAQRDQILSVLAPATIKRLCATPLHLGQS